MPDINDVIAVVGAALDQAKQEGAASRQAEVDALNAQVAELQAELAALQPEQPAPTLDFGVYRGGNNADLDTWADGWNLTAQTFYMSHWQRSTAVIEAALAKGRDVYIAWDTKDKKVGDTQTFTAFSDVAAGKIDADITWWRGALAALKAKYPARQIHVAIAHEAEIPKRNPADNAAAFVQMTHRFSQMMRDKGSGLKVVYWAASGTTKSFYGDAADFDLVTADRYKKGDHPVGETMAGTFQPFVDTLNTVGRGWEKLPRGITETGIVVPKFTPAQQSSWWLSMPDAIRTHNLSLVMAFMSNRDLTYVPTDASVKETMKQVYAALA
jgi:hypothetical protein